MCQEIVQPEAGVVDSESIHSGNVLVQSIHPGSQPRLTGISIRNKAVYSLCERERQLSRLRPLAWLL